jgi:hypothetical protein
MICDICGGDGVLPIVNIDENTGPVLCGEEPCFECGGTGIIHCCEGLREQPEPARREDGDDR